MASPPADPAGLFDPRTYAEGVPYELIAELRANGPVQWIPEPAVLGWEGGPGYWAVLSHEGVNQVLRDPATYSSHLGATQIRDPGTAAQLAFVQRMMLNQDPPEHSRLRRLLNRSFTPRAITALEASIDARADAIVERVAEWGECDFATDVGADLPLLVLAEILGVPESDRMLLFDWSNRVIGYQDGEYASSSKFDPSSATDMARRSLEVQATIVAGPDGRLPDPRSREGLADMYAYAHDLANHRRQHPGDDVVSLLLSLDDEGGPVTDDEFETMFFLFAVAGNETLRNGIPSGMLCLLEHPDQYTRLEANPALLPGAIEEMLRFAPPVVHFRRTAAIDTELHGQKIAAGQKVVVYHAAANRDPVVFSNPDAFDIERTPNDHVTFGAGPHFCLGSHLARRQMSAIFTSVLRRLPRLELAGEPERLVSNFQNGLKHLPVRWQPGGN